MTLNDRIEEIYKNYTFCEKNCVLDEILYEDKMINCNCTIKNNLNVKSFNFDLVSYKISKKNMNYQVLKCSNALTNLKNNLFNLGFWIFSFLMLLNIILLILLCCLDIKPIQLFMQRQLAKYGYIDKGDEGHAFCHNYVNKLNKLIDRLNKMKDDYIYKKDKKNPPQKHKQHIINNSESSVKNILINKKGKKPKNKFNLEIDIQNLKNRMENTKKPKNKDKSTSRVLIEDSNKDNKSPLTKSKINLQTQNEIKEDDKQNAFQLNLININVKQLNKEIYIPNESKHILNIYEFEEAVKYDKRGICPIYFIFLISKQVIMHAFLYKSQIEPLPLRLSILKFMLGCDLAMNAIFYTDNKISERHKSKKNLIAFALTNNIVAIIIALLIGFFFLILLSNINNITNELRQIFRDEENKIKKDKNYVVSLQRKKEIILEVKRILKKFKIKVAIFYIIEFLLMIFFWYCVTVFCYVYKKTQASWIVNSIITIIIRIILDLIINLLFSIIYTCSISSNSNCLYKLIIFLYCFA